MRPILWCSGLAMTLGAWALAVPADAQSLTRLLDGTHPLAPAAGIVVPAQAESDRPAVVDYGPGPGRPPAWPAVQRASSPALAGIHAGLTTAIPTGPSNASTGGLFGPAVSWPIIPLHMVLLPSGRVLSYGTDAKGAQGAQFIYDVWDPARGTGVDAHLVLPNTTGTDIFCSAQSLMWNSGTALLAGGDRIVGGKRNYSNNKTTLFDTSTNNLSAGPAMQYPRWYASIVPLPDGRKLVVGGRADPQTSVLVPELYDPAAGWTTLTGATSQSAFQDYYYPRAFVAPSGNVFLLTSNTVMMSISVSGVGSISRYSVQAPSSIYALPTVMVSPGKLLSVRSAKVVTVDINGKLPVVATTGNLSQTRLWASATVLPDGHVVVTGGSQVMNQLIGVAYNAELWDPATGVWTLGAAATKPRLYHSNALLLPDATVLTGGGGAPGPVKNLNAEIYYPPYLFLPSGQPAPRPSLVTAPGDIAVGASFAATVGATDQISRVTFVRAGSATHSVNLEQRFLDLPFSQTGSTITASLPTNANVVSPGYWMLFVWQNGVPSVAQIVRVPG